ncbi:MAG: phosphoribosylanthranilate isomerase [Vicinamibacterales bacterium]
MIVKVCGITREADAAAAVEQGASAIGFIFWPRSARYIEPARARAIVRTLPPFVTTVGVFVNAAADEVNAAADVAGLAAVQLHGEETPDLVPMLTRPVVKAMGQIDAVGVDAWPSHVRLLVDADDRVQRGGTGKRADWDAAALLARRRPILLAGGLTPENVEDAIARVRPFGIDVSSGVEDAPGLKNPEKIRALFEAVRRATRA